MSEEEKFPKPPFVYEAEAAKLRAEAEQLTAQAAKEREEQRRLTAAADSSEIDLLVKRRQLQINEADNDFHRIYRFGTSVDEKSAAACMSTCDVWRRIYPGEPITIIFTSPGGSVVAGMALWDYFHELRTSGTHLTTKAEGMAASMAGILLQAGDKRVMGKESYLLIHEVQAGMMGSYGELEDRMKWLEKVQQRILDIFAERASAKTGTEFKRMRKLFEQNWRRTDWWLDSTDALRLGLIDEVS